MKNWEEILKSGIVPKSYPAAHTSESRHEHFFADMEPETADKMGQRINRSIRTARGKPDEDTPSYMKQQWGWSDRELDQASSFFHVAPAHARPHIEVNGLRPNLTGTVGNPHEMKQRYGVFGSIHRPEPSYGLEAAHPDEAGTRKADIYRVSIPQHDLRIDPYGYPFAERTVKPHEFERIGHVTQTGNEDPKVCTHPEEECPGK
jgi:hypothetical protein